MFITTLGRWLGALSIASVTAVVVASCGSGADGSAYSYNDAAPDTSFGDAFLPEAGTFHYEGGNGCVPKTCQSAGWECGQNGDGCGNILACGTCDWPAFCGGGGYSKCGGNINYGRDGGPVCTPETCGALGYDCGVAGDGCGNALDCGTCTDPKYCGGGGFNKCGGNNGLQADGAPPCTPTTCAAKSYTCGTAADGCGGLLHCGSCIDPQFCGGGGFDVCGGDNGLGPDGAPPCTPITCASKGYTCGTAGDGCGGKLDCGTCTDPQYCGGGGYDMCGGDNGLGPDGGVPCTSKTCIELHFNCGVAADGCGNALNCGTCTNPEYCGANGNYDVCGGNNGLGSDGGITCTPETCATLGYTCGLAGDGCGNQIDCGKCTGGAYCGGGGFNVCGTTGLLGDGGVPCTPVTCGQLGFNCGPAGDGCGNTLDCGACTDPQSCGGGGQPSVCGGNNGLGADGGPKCVPLTCATAPGGPYNCGTLADGCGGLIASCGTCTNPQFCGGGGYDVCGGDNGLGSDGGVLCTPTTCKKLGFNCGSAGDGCDSTPLNCGTCTDPQYCGGGGFNVCGGDNGLNPDGSVPCTPTTCKKLGYNCGTAADGCGGLLTCGACSNPQICGGGGSYDVCGGNNGLTDSGVPVCTPTTCGALGYDCGSAGDGCGNALNCGTCTGGAYCGGGGFDKCGTSGLSSDGGVPCTPTTCLAQGYNCGVASDGCGNALNCGTCANPQFCGASSFDVCGGNNGLGGDGGVLCTPTTCTSLGFNCGQAGDGCGGTLNCGTCVDPQYCGGGGPSICGGNNGLTDSGVPVCTPATCVSLGYNCGQAGDGCGGTLDCGTCTDPQYCGGGGPSVCGGNNGLGSDAGPTCTPATCVGLGFNCGFAADGCGGQLNCGTCTDPQYCGGGGYDICGGDNGQNPDGSVICFPTTCATLGYNCGVAGDGCGGTLNCGTCVAPQSCGLGGYDVCGPLTDGGSFVDCEGSSTTVTGFVYDPGGNLPIYNALVYVPIGAVVQPETGVNSGTCGCAAPAAFTSTTTGVDGSFTLPNVPVGTAIQVVVQLGKWQITYTENVAACVNNIVGTLPLPSQHAPVGTPWPPNGNLGYGNIPLFAVDTGAVDTMECVLSKMGINTAEFVDPVLSGGVPTAAGRVHFYQGSIVAGGAIIDGATPGESALTESLSVMESYDAILFPCQGAKYPGLGAVTGYDTTSEGNLGTYSEVGGRFFATHFSYGWLYNNTAPEDFQDDIANWTPSAGSFTPQFTGHIDTSFATGSVLSQWLYQGAVGASTTLGEIPVDVVRNDFSSVIAPASQDWMYTQNTDPPNQGLPTMQIHFTFDTPVGGTACGRGVFSDFHVEDASNNKSTNKVFPAECTGGATGSMTPQEKLLAFMLFDLTSCVSTPTCTPLTCVQLGYTCGTQGDGCGGTLDCGGCTSPQTCGGGGIAGQCGAPDAGVCAPLTCAQQGYNCGPAGDGCGALLNCGNCLPPLTCGGGGAFGQCGFPDAGACTPLSCLQQGLNCGPAGDGCGGPLDCGSCTFPETCGGGGIAGQCGFPDAGACNPLSCTDQGINCGPAGDGCGNPLDCGGCPGSQTCGGGGVAGQCGYPDGGACVPVDCTTQGISCGMAGDGCGNQLDCGTCVSPQTCGGGGVAGQCGFPEAGVCQPETCAQQNINCGPAGDGCGNSLSCGTCPTPQTCGGGGVAGQCGFPDAGACVPATCIGLNINCGPAGDGCGGQLDCGMCVAPQTCGGSGTYGQCGFPDGGACVPETCATQHITCGPAGDGCGGSLSCGTCTAPQTCGGGGTYGQCGFPDAGPCVPTSCTTLNITCGPASDGCGNLLDCGNCPSPQSCGGGGVYGQCGFPDSGACVPETCKAEKISCGPAGDGCGGLLDCGPCITPQTCGGGGVSGQCGYPEAGSCSPETCATQHITCGPAGDGCGKSLQCGTCTLPATCGGGGVYGQCGMPDGGACVPVTCADQGITCGAAGDGCGGTLACGGCKAPETCGGGGMAGTCGYPDGGVCNPLSCADQSITCGPAGNGCGGLVQCGGCPPPETCGGGGMAGMCGYPDGGVCSPLTCSDQGITCGPAGDGCGGVISSCGTCASPQTCGGGGMLGKCGYPEAGACKPQTCAEQSIACGPAGDGCGNELMCGTCAPPLVCGGGGTYGQCGMPDGGDCIPLSCTEQNINCGPAGDGCGNLIMCGTCSGQQTCGGAGMAGQCGGGAQ